MPTEESPIMTSLQMTIEFVAAIDEDEESVVDILGSVPWNWTSNGLWRARGGLAYGRGNPLPDWPSKLHSLVRKISLPSLRPYLPSGSEAIIWPPD